MKRIPIRLLCAAGGLALAALFTPFTAATPTPAASAHAPLADTIEMVKETRSTIVDMEWNHYLQKPYAKMDQRDLLRSYMANLDSRHLFLLQSEVTGFQDQYAPQLVHDVRELGDLTPAYTIFNKFSDAVHQRVAWINKYLDGDVNLQAKDTYHPDRIDSVEHSPGDPSVVFTKNVPWPATKEDADKLWDKQIRFEVLNELLAAETLQIDTANKKTADAAKPAPPADAPPATTANVVKSWQDQDPNAATDKPATTAKPKADAAPKTFAQLLADAKETVRKRYNSSLKAIDDTAAIDVQDVFLNTLAGQYDPHSSFYTENGLEDFDIQMRNTLIGIGAILEPKDDYCSVSDLIPGGPAQTSNLLHHGDRIIAVGQSADGEMVDVVKMSLTKTVRLIRGAEGTPVFLKIIPDGLTEGDAKVITLIRKKIELTTALAKAQVIEMPVGDHTVPIGVIDLPAFYGKGGEADKYSTTDDVKELLSKLQTFGVKGIVLDLRNNGGGFLNEAIDLAGLFIPPSPVLQVRTALGFVTQLKNEDSAPVWNGPLILLVSKQSASATEIFAGALQDYHRALVVGDHTTHGKGTVQQVFNFNVFDPTEKGAAKVTIEKWYLPDGNSIQSRGVFSDIPLPSDIDFLPIGEGDIINAMATDSVKPVPLVLHGDGLWRNFLVSDSLIAQLRAQSEARQNSLNEFALIKQRIAWEKSREDAKEISLNYDTRMAERRHDMAFRDELKKNIEDLAKNNFKSTEILTDAAAKDAAAKEAAAKEAAAKTKDKPAKSKTPPASTDSTLPLNGITSLDEADPATPPVSFDVQLREGLRIMTDWLNLENQPSTSPSVAFSKDAPVTPAAQPAGEAH